MPFAGPEWQLWVNHTLAHAEAEALVAEHALFAVWAPAANAVLLQSDILNRFQARLATPASFRFLPLDDLIGRIGSLSVEKPELKMWADGLVARYSGI